MLITIDELLSLDLTLLSLKLSTVLLCVYIGCCGKVVVWVGNITEYMYLHINATFIRQLFFFNDFKRISMLRK
jgi:hypothetical protein